MRPIQLSRFLAASMKAQLPILITGSPGLGKTAITEQAAASIEAEMIYTDAGTSDPTRIEGMPWPQPSANEAVFLPFGDLARALRATSPTVWLFDDIGWATLATQNSLAHLIHERRTPSGARLPDCVSIVGTTNKRTDKSNVTGMSLAVMSRFASIVELEANLDDWVLWAEQNGVPLELIFFLQFQRSAFYEFSSKLDMENFPCPRTWVNAGKLSQLGLDPDTELAAISGAVGSGAAAAFHGFLQICRDLPSIDGILMDPETAKIPVDNPGALFAVCMSLSERATVTNFPRVLRYAERMHEYRDRSHPAGLSQFTALLLRDAFKRNRDLCDCRPWIKMMAGPIGQLIRG